MEENGHKNGVDDTSPKVSMSMPQMNTSSPQVTANQLEPTSSMKVENPLTRVESPAAVRPPGWVDPRGSIGGDVRAAMGIGLDFLDDKEAEKKKQPPTPSTAEDFGNSS